MSGTAISTTVSAFIEPGDPKWTRFLEGAPHDFYHLPSYTRMVSKYEGGTPVAFYAEIGRSSFLMPLLIRTLPQWLGAPKSWTDAASPYGYPGPLIRNSHNPETGRAFLRALGAEASRRDIISIFLRLHPLLNDAPQIFGEIGHVIRHGETVYIDLRKSLDEIWSELRRGHRDNIQKLRQLGFTIEFDGWERLDGFIAAYRATMHRVSASNFYHFPESYFLDLREALGNRLHLCTVQAPNGEVASGSLFTLVSGIAQNHLAATNDKYLQLGPSKLMTYSQVRWLKYAGGTVFHLGGGVSSHADSLFHFKAGFSRLRASFCTCSVVVDEDRYKRLTNTAGAVIGEDEDFFPAYRRPQASTTTS